MVLQFLTPLTDRHLLTDWTAIVTMSTSDSDSVAVSALVSLCWHSTVTMYPRTSSRRLADDLQRQRTMSGKSATLSTLSSSTTPTLLSHDTHTHTHNVYCNRVRKHGLTSHSTFWRRAFPSNSLHPSTNSQPQLKENSQNTQNTNVNATKLVLFKKKSSQRMHTSANAQHQNLKQWSGIQIRIFGLIWMSVGSDPKCCGCIIFSAPNRKSDPESTRRSRSPPKVNHF